MDRPPYLFSLDKAQDMGACGYYRIHVPLRGLKKLAQYEIYHDEGENFEEGLQAMFTSDYCHFYSLVGTDFLHRIKTIHAMQPGIIGDGSLHLPPTTIWDCDDNHDFVHPLNTTFAWMGTRTYPSVDLLEPGDTLEIELENGERLRTWEDGVTKSRNVTFNISDNLFNMKIRHEIIRTVHGVTCASKHLADYIKNVIGQKNVHFFPNTVMAEDYENFPLVHDDEVRILWQGGMSHFVDWYPLRDAVKAVAAKYPKAKWIIFGENFNWISDVIPPEQCEIVGWIPYSAYKLRRGLFRADINLCPLTNNIFNISKSAIKWYEGSIWSNPEATLAQRVGPYADEMVDNETGLLFDTPNEFAEKLGLLIEDAQLRRRLGMAAKQWVKDNRTPEKTIPGLVEFHQECRRIRSREAIQLGASETEIKQLAMTQGLR